MFKDIFSKSFIFGLLTSLLFVFSITYASSGSIGVLFERISWTTENGLPADWQYRLVWQNIKDGTVTSYELAANSVTQNKLATWSVTNSKLASDSVTTDKIANYTILTEDLALDFKAPLATFANESGTASHIAWVDLALEKEVVDELNTYYIKKPSSACNSIWEILQLTSTWELICVDTSAWSD